MAGHTQARIAQLNRETVFRALRTLDRPVTISFLATQVEGISNRTVRRSLDALVKTGCVRQLGRQNNAILFECVSPEMSVRHMKEPTADKPIPIGNGSDYVSVADFIAAMVDPESQPFRGDSEVNVISAKVSAQIQRMMTFVIMSSGEAGYDDQMATVRGNLIKIRNSLAFIVSCLDAFEKSGVWYTQVRGRMAFSVRELQREMPDLFALARDFMKGG